MEVVARRVGCEPSLPVSYAVAYNVHMLVSISLALHWFNVAGSWSYLWDFLLWLGTLISFLLLRDGLFFKWWFYPHWTVWYRQRGPGADPSNLQAVLTRVDKWRATAIIRGFVLLLIWSTLALCIQWLLSVPMFVVHTSFLRFPRRWGAMLRPKMFALHGAE
jgi:hypothetical protein